VPKSAILLPLLSVAFSTGWTGCGSTITNINDIDASVIGTGCPDFLDYDGGRIGSAQQVLTLATAAVNAWKPDLEMTGLQGKVSPDGTDVDGGWTFTFANPTVSGLATVEPFATHTIVAGDCGYMSDEPVIRDFKIDSPLALAIAVDAGCVFGSIVPVRLAGQSDSSSPLYGIDPAWLITATVAGRAGSCVVNAVTGAFGFPVDGGISDGG
jgi:hypothetical protein